MGFSKRPYIVCALIGKGARARRPVSTINSIDKIGGVDGAPGNFLTTA